MCIINGLTKYQIDWNEVIFNQLIHNFDILIGITCMVQEWDFWKCYGTLLIFGIFQVKKYFSNLVRIISILCKISCKQFCYV